MLAKGLRKIAKFRVKKGRELLIFLICLFLAFAIWSIDKLSDSYTHIFQYRVQLFEQSEREEEPFLSQNRLSLRVQSTGFDIIKYHLAGKKRELALNLKSATINREKWGERRSYLLTNDIKDGVVALLSHKIAVDYFITDTLFFNIAEQQERVVPIKLNYKISFKEQYINPSQPKITPSSITVWGAKERVSELDSLYTESLVISGSDRNESGVVKIKKLAGVRFSQEEVLYSIESVRYVEISQSVDVEVINIPKGWSAELYPPTTTLLLRERLAMSSYLRNFKAKVVLDCKELKTPTKWSLDTVVAPTLVNMPEGAIGYRLEPPLVEVGLFKNRE
ncbi:MAG: hypothetical protein WC960_06735 [Bacteroidales bacterium]